MAKCIRCQAETELYSGGVPICLKCASEADLRKGQQQENGKQPKPEGGKAA